MIRVFILLASIVCLVACKKEAITQHVAEQAEPTEVELPADFLDFYEEFHRDTLFQLNHIAFPLSGKPASGQFNIELTDFKWTRKGWVFHKRISDDDDTFDRKYQMFTPELIIELIYAPTYGYYMERRFGKLSDGWNLIYYEDMQEPKNE